MSTARALRIFRRSDAGLLKRLQQGAAHRLFSSSESPSASASASTHTAINAAAANSKSRTWDEHRLSSDQLQFRDLASEFAQRELMPFAAEWDERKYFPVEVLRSAAKLGFGGVFCGHDVGGSQYEIELLCSLSVMGTP
jgi:hypothetical protein